MSASACTRSVPGLTLVVMYGETEVDNQNLKGKWGLNSPRFILIVS